MSLRSILRQIVLAVLIPCALAAPPALAASVSLSPLLAPEPAKEAAAPEKPAETAPPAFPGLADAAAMAAELGKKAAETNAFLALARQTDDLIAQIAGAKDRYARLAAQMARIGDPAGLDMTRLTDARLLVLKERKNLEALVAAISGRLADLEALRDDWDKRRAFWQDWQAALTAAKAELPQETFGKARQTIDAALKSITGATAAIVVLQDGASKLLQDSIRLGEPIEAAMARQRGDTLKKLEPSFASPRFLSQLAEASWPPGPSGLLDAISQEEVREAVGEWSFLGRIVLFAAFAYLSLAMRRDPRAAGSWVFFTRHPLACGIFLSEIITSLFFPEQAGLIRHVRVSMAVAALAVLVCGLPEARPARPAVVYLAAMAVASGLLTVIALPVPHYRLYAALAALCGAVLLWRLPARQGGRGQGQGRPLAIASRLGAMVMALSALAQAAGFVTFADSLIFEMIGLCSIVGGAAVLTRFAAAGIEFTLCLPRVARLDFITRFGSAIAARLSVIARVVVYGLAGVALFRILGVYGSTDQALAKFFQFEITIGSLTLTPSLILWAAFILYLSSSLSWLLRALLESEVFPRNQVDPGAAEAITRLLHYFLIFSGFMIGMGVMGFELRNFAVLGGALGIGIGFGLQNIVNNFVSGLILLFERPIKAGDRVAVDKELGIVKSIGLRSTVIETFDRSELIVPNSQFISQMVTNMTLSSTIARLKIPVGAAYGSDIGLVMKLLTGAGAANPRVLADPAPTAYLVRFGESSLDFELHVWLANVGELLIAQSELCQDIAGRFAAAGVEIPFPQRDVRLSTPPGQP